MRLNSEGNRFAENSQNEQVDKTVVCQILIVGSKNQSITCEIAQEVSVRIYYYESIVTLDHHSSNLYLSTTRFYLSPSSAKHLTSLLKPQLTKKIFVAVRIWAFRATTNTTIKLPTRPTTSRTRNSGIEPSSTQLGATTVTIKSSYSASVRFAISSSLKNHWLFGKLLLGELLLWSGSNERVHGIIFRFLERCYATENRRHCMSYW